MLVYTDEGGGEQSLVGKIVYQTNESGQSNIVIQEVQQQVEGNKLVRIDLGNMEGYMMAGQGEEEEERRLEEDLGGREARLEEELDLQAAKQGRKRGARWVRWRGRWWPARCPARPSSATQCWSAGPRLRRLVVLQRPDPDCSATSFDWC